MADSGSAMNAQERPLRTLHLDIEGGWGGSSRSLYELVARLDPQRVAPLVAHRQQGPVVDRYRNIGVPTVHVPEIGSFVPRRTKSVRNLVVSLPRLWRLEAAAKRLAGLASLHGAQVVHLNYEGLFLLAPRLRRRTRLPLICHCRALWPENRWGRWLARSLVRHADQLLAISPQEQARIRSLLGGNVPVPVEVMWNIASAPPAPATLPEIPEAVYLGSIDRAKGTDRLVEIARCLEESRAPSLRIAVYGVARTDPTLLERLTRLVARDNLQTRIAFRGHTSQPETVLARALALIRPSRENDPWGRDVIEATRAGVPVLATGTFTGVVKPGNTGFLFPEFDARAMASRLSELVRDPALRTRLSDAARARGEQLFSGFSQAARFAALVEVLAGQEIPG